MSEDFSLFIPDDHLDPLEALAIIDDSINHHSENPETKREVQEGLSWITHKMRDFSVSMTANVSLRRIHQLEDILKIEDQKLEDVGKLKNEKIKWTYLDRFMKFSRGDDDSLEEYSDATLVLCLTYLFLHIELSGRHILQYVETCLRLSQIPGKDTSVLMHTNYIVSKYFISEQELEESVIPKMVDDCELPTFEEYQEFIGETSENDEQQYDVYVYNLACSATILEFLSQSLGTLNLLKIYTKPQRQKLYDLLNDFRDFLDPKLVFSLFFASQRTTENAYRQQLVDREVAMLH